MACSGRSNATVGQRGEEGSQGSSGGCRPPTSDATQAKWRRRGSARGDSAQAPMKQFDRALARELLVLYDRGHAQEQLVLKTICRGL